MTGRNWFFAALARHAREHGGELAEWLNEAGAVARCEQAAVRSDDRARLPRPDGAGTWAEDGRFVSFLLEYDAGTKNLGVLAGKLDGYAVLAAGLAWHDQPCPVLLFCFGTRAGSRPPAAPWPLPARPPGCGSLRRRSTVPHQPGRAGLAAPAPGGRRPGAADRPGAGAADPWQDYRDSEHANAARPPTASRPCAAPARTTTRRRSRWHLCRRFSRRPAWPLQDADRDATPQAADSAGQARN